MSQCFNGTSRVDDCRRPYVTLVLHQRPSGTPSCWCRCTITACPTRSAPAAPARGDPCGVFRNIAFPVGEFFLPNSVRKPEN